MSIRLLPIKEAMRRKILHNPYEIKETDIGRLIDSKSSDFGETIPADVGKRVYLRNGILQMENTEQRNKRKGKGFYEERTPTPEGDKAIMHRDNALKALASQALNKPMKVKKMNKIIYYAPTSTMGETSESDAEKYRVWAEKELQKKFPDFEIEVSDQENTNSFWTNIDDIQMNDRIEMIIGNLWDYCPWDF